MTLFVSKTRDVLEEFKMQKLSEGFLLYDTAKMLLLDDNLVRPKPGERLLLVNLEILDLSSPFIHSKKNLFQWLGKVVRKELCFATFLKLSSAPSRTLLKLQLLFPNTQSLDIRSRVMPSLCPVDDFWRHVVGYSHVKAELDKFVRWRFEKKDQLAKMGLGAVSSHVLLHGTSGNGKTFLAEQFRNLGISFISLKASDVFSMWYGESERLLRDAFERARECRPCLLFIDEIDTLGRSRNSEEGGAVNARVLSTLLNELDGVDSEIDDVLVLACSNQLSLVDSALLRPGRLGALVEVDVPGSDDRAALLSHFLQLEDVPEPDLVSKCDGWSVLQIETMCTRAKYSALRRGGTAVDADDFSLIS